MYDPGIREGDTFLFTFDPGVHMPTLVMAKKVYPPDATKPQGEDFKGWWLIEYGE